MGKEPRYTPGELEAIDKIVKKEKHKDVSLKARKIADYVKLHYVSLHNNKRKK